MATKDEVTSEELSQTAVDPATLNVAAGVALTDLQRRHVAVVLDLWQRRGTRAKLEENFVEDVLYEDHFAVCKDRKEFAGQLLNIPTTTKGYETEYYQVTSSSPAQTETGSGRAVQADELNVRFKHKLHFVPTGTMNIDTTLIIFSSAQEGKIVRLQDRPADELSDNSLIKAMKRGQVLMTEKLIPLPKNDKEDAEKVQREQR